MKLLTLILSVLFACSSLFGQASSNSNKIKSRRFENPEIKTAIEERALTSAIDDTIEARDLDITGEWTFADTVVFDLATVTDSLEVDSLHVTTWADFDPDVNIDGGLTVDKNLTVTDSTLNAGSNLFAGQLSFTTTDTVDTLANSAISSTDIFIVTLVDTANNALLKGVMVKEDTLFVARESGTSGASWNYLRIKKGY